MKQISLISKDNYISDNTFDQFAKQVKQLKSKQEYSLTLSWIDNPQIIKKAFELLFRKQRPNLIKLKFKQIKLFPESFKLFTQKRWEKLINIHLCKYLFNSEKVEFNNQCQLLFSQCSIPALETIKIQNCELSEQFIERISKTKYENLKQFIFAKWEKLQGFHVCSHNYETKIVHKIQEIGNNFDFPSLQRLSICIHFFIKENLPESAFSNIDKRKQPELKDLDLRHCPISGKLLFDLKTNVGWPKLESLRLNGEQTDHQLNNFGFRNICQYNFRNLMLLYLRRTTNIQIISNLQRILLSSSQKQNGTICLKQLQVNINQNTDNCNLNDQSLKILRKCAFQLLKELNLGKNCFSDKCTEIMFDQKWNQLLNVSLRTHQLMLACKECSKFICLNLPKCYSDQLYLFLFERVDCPKTIYEMYLCQ